MFLKEDVALDWLYFLNYKTKSNSESMISPMSDYLVNWVQSES